MVIRTLRRLLSVIIYSCILLKDSGVLSPCFLHDFESRRFWLLPKPRKAILTCYLSLKVKMMDSGICAKVIATEKPWI